IAGALLDRPQCVMRRASFAAFFRYVNWSQKMLRESISRRRFLAALTPLSVMIVLTIALAQPLHSRRAHAQAQAGVAQQPREHFDLPISIEAPIEPIAVKGTDGKWHLVYHLFLTNWSFSDLTLKSVEVSDGVHSDVEHSDRKQGKTLARYEDKELSD